MLEGEHPYLGQGKNILMVIQTKPLNLSHLKINDAGKTLLRGLLEQDPRKRTWKLLQRNPWLEMRDPQRTVQNRVPSPRNKPKQKTKGIGNSQPPFDARDWIMLLDPSSGKMYYANVKTQSTRWDPPPGFVVNQANLNPGYQPTAPSQPIPSPSYGSAMYSQQQQPPHGQYRPNQLQNEYGANPQAQWQQQRSMGYGSSPLLTNNNSRASSPKSKGKRKQHKKKKKHRHKSKKGSVIPPPPDDDVPPPPPLMTKMDPTTDDEDGSSSAASSDSDDYKDVMEVHSGKKPGNGKFEKKSNFICRRPVSGVPMDVQKKRYNKKKESQSSHLSLIHSKRTEKTDVTVMFLKHCLLKEVLFNGMDDSMITEIVAAMYRVDCPNGESIIKQNEIGDAYFVIESGSFDIIHRESQNDPQRVVGEMLPGKAFGEGSLLYSMPRAATLTATKASVVWALDASKFVEIRRKLSQSVNNKASKIVRSPRNKPKQKPKGFGNSQHDGVHGKQGPLPPPPNSSPPANAMNVRPVQMGYSPQNNYGYNPQAQWQQQQQQPLGYGSSPNLNYNQFQQNNMGNAAMYAQQQQPPQGQYRPNQMQPFPNQYHPPPPRNNQKYGQ